MWCRHQCLRWLNLEVNKEVFMISATLFNNDSPLSPIWRWIIYYYCFSTYHTSSKESAKNYFICDNKLKNDWFLEVCALLHAQRWRYLYIITSELANMCQKHYSLVWYILKQNIALFVFFSKTKTELRLIQFNIGWPKRFQKFINHYD